MTVAADKPTLLGVRVLGFRSENGRKYLPEAVRRSLPIYEGCKVNVDHPSQPNAMRGVGERFGVLRNVREDNGGLKADLHYNPEHALAKTVRWWAENEPAAIGLSHNAVGEGHTRDGVFIVENIVKVRSVDIVADPATAKTLYEAQMDDDTLAGDLGTGDAGYDEHIGNAVVSILKDGSLSMADKRKKVLAALKLLDDDGGGEKKDDEKKPVETKESKDALEAVVQELRVELDRYKVKEALAAKQTKCRKLCTEAKLPEHVITDVFMEQLVAAKDDAALKSLIEDRRSLAGGRRITSLPPGTGGKEMSVDDFVKAVQ